MQHILHQSSLISVALLNNILVLNIYDAVNEYLNISEHFQIFLTT